MGRGGGGFGGGGGWGGGLGLAGHLAPMTYKTIGLGRVERKDNK